VVNLFRTELPDVTVEILTPDFRGREDCLDIVFASRPAIFNHNIETTRRLTPKVRNKATYDRTLFVLKKARKAGLVTNSGIMVGHGETKEELLETMRDLRAVDCQMLTLGQYLPPSTRHLPLQRYYHPEEFDELRQEGLQYGFVDVAAGPLVRSSFHADELLKKLPLSSSPSRSTIDIGSGRTGRSGTNVSIGDPEFLDSLKPGLPLSRE
jgi:lipoic acid synthetase